MRYICLTQLIQMGVCVCVCGYACDTTWRRPLQIVFQIFIFFCISGFYHFFVSILKVDFHSFELELEDICMAYICIYYSIWCVCVRTKVLLKFYEYRLAKKSTINTFIHTFFFRNKSDRLKIPDFIWLGFYFVCQVNINCLFSICCYSFLFANFSVTSFHLRSYTFIFAKKIPNIQLLFS